VTQLDGIGNEGASALANALTVSTSMMNINLCYNGIGDEGASALADALEANSLVKNINISFNQSAPRVHHRLPTR
jgi:hypothetical protein